MSFDLILWTGAPTAPSRRWAALGAATTEDGAAPLPTEALVGAFRSGFGDVHVRQDASGVEVVGRGWECAWRDGSWTTVSCRWVMAEDPAGVAAIVRAAHVAGCSVYDPQSGAHWPVSSGGLTDDDPWGAAHFDEGIVFEDEADDLGHVPDRAVRLCPRGVWPPARQVWLDAPVDVARQDPALVRHRVRTYRERFPGWDVEVVFSGAGAADLGDDEGRSILRRLEVPFVVAPEVASVTFGVLGGFEPGRIVDRVAPCPFELVPTATEQLLLAGIFGEVPVRVWVVVPTRVLRAAPETVRAGLRSLHAAAAADAGWPVHFVDAAAPPEGPVGANLGWVERLLGLAPSEPPVDVNRDDVPRPADDGAPDDEDDGVTGEE